MANGYPTISSRPIHCDRPRSVGGTVIDDNDLIGKPGLLSSKAIQAG